MKGIIFTEFLDMVEDRFSADVAEEMIERSDLESGGAYTMVGSYDHRELLQLVTHLSDLTGAPVRDLVMAYGQFLFSRFVAIYPEILEGIDDPLDFLESVESHIHVEVRKLYPDAELPSLLTRRLDEQTLEATYRSSRPFADVAHALILGCMNHFGSTFDLDRVEGKDDESAFTVFTVRLRAGVPA